MSNNNNMPKDSGSKREFSTGAHRDAATGKGRCDLLPLDEVAMVMNNDPVIAEVAAFVKDFDPQHLANAIQEAVKTVPVYENMANAILEASLLYEAGAIKYGENNWQRGMPLSCYIDSGLRHYLKTLRGDDDEPHYRGFVWNMLCAMWTLKNVPNATDGFKKVD